MHAGGGGGGGGYKPTTLRSTIEMVFHSLVRVTNSKGGRGLSMSVVFLTRGCLSK